MSNPEDGCSSGLDKTLGRSTHVSPDGALVRSLKREHQPGALFERLNRKNGILLSVLASPKYRDIRSSQEHPVPSPSFVEQAHVRAYKNSKPVGAVATVCHETLNSETRIGRL